MKRNTIRKLMAALLAAALWIMSAGALADSTLRTAFDAASDLAFRTENVTLRGNAEFRLDGARFKTAEATYIQDGENSFWQLRLFTPHEGDEERETGYTIIANGEQVFVMEMYTPGTYRAGTTEAQTTILRHSVQMGVMAELAGLLADQAELLFGADAVTSGPDGQGGTAVRVMAGEDVPMLVNTALNLLWEYGAKRYFSMDYDRVDEQWMGSIDAYPTFTQGILGTTKYVALKQVDAEAVTDADGNLARVGGSLSLTLVSGRDGTHRLDISFRLDVTDRGTSRVRRFDPADYGVVLAENTAYYAGENQGEDVSEEQIAERVENGKALWRASGYTIDESMDGTTYMEAGRTFYEFWTQDESMDLFCFTDGSGNLLSMSSMVNRWEGQSGAYRMDAFPDEQLVRYMEEKTLNWLGEVNPEARARTRGLVLIWWYQDGDELYFGFEEDEISPDGQRVNMVIRVQPDWRIESYSSISFG